MFCFCPAARAAQAAAGCGHTARLPYPSSLTLGSQVTLALRARRVRVGQLQLLGVQRVVRIAARAGRQQPQHHLRGCTVALQRRRAARRVSDGRRPRARARVPRAQRVFRQARGGPCPMPGALHALQDNVGAPSVCLGVLQRRPQAVRASGRACCTDTLATPSDGPDVRI